MAVETYKLGFDQWFSYVAASLVLYRFKASTTHPQNIFAEALLLFVVGLSLLVRDKGSAEASTAYDTLLGSLLLVFSLVRFLEFLGGTADSHVMARTLMWTMWLIPAIILGWITYHHRRWDVAVLLGISIFAILIVTIYLVSGAGGYDILTPDQRVGSSNGIYTWIRTDGGSAFLSFSYYILLTVALIYLTAFSLGDRYYWLLAGAAIVAYIVTALMVPQVVRNPLGTLGSLSTLVMLGVGVFAILIVPG